MAKKAIAIDEATYVELAEYLRETGYKQFVVASKAIKQYLEKQKTAEAVN